MSTDVSGTSREEVAREEVVEDRARRICSMFKVDPDEIVDPYGPVRQWDGPAYHINEAIEALLSDRERAPVQVDVAALVRDLAAEPPGGEVWERSRRFAAYAERARQVLESKA